MIELKNREELELYKQIKDLIMSYNDKKGFEYNKKQHSLYEADATPELRARFYNEYGKAEFINTQGNLVIVEISRWHPHKHNGWSGLNSTPCLYATISIKRGEEKEILWELKVGSGTLYYKAEVTSVDIPNDILLEAPKDELTDEQELVPSTEMIKESTPHETRNLLETLNDLRKKQVGLVHDKDELIRQQNIEIQRATEQVRASYQKKIEQTEDSISLTEDELAKLDALISKYTTFNDDLIGKTIAELLNTIECESYTYQTARHSTQKRVHGIIDSWDEEIQNQVKLIILTSQQQSAYSSQSEYESRLSKLVKDGRAIILSEQDIYKSDNKQITFYTSKNGEISSLIDFGCFSYIKDFINTVIQYRFQNGIEAMTSTNMIHLMREFLINNRETILSNYRVKIEQKVLAWNPNISTN